MSSFLFFCSVLLLAKASHGIKHKHIQVGKGVKNPLSLTLPVKKVSVLDKIDASKMKQLDEHFEIVYIYEAYYPYSVDVIPKVCTITTTPAVEPDSIATVPWCFPLEDDDYYRSLGYSYQGTFTSSTATLSEPGQIEIQTLYFRDSSTCDLKKEDGFLGEGTQTIPSVVTCFQDEDGDLARHVYSTSQPKDADVNVFPYFYEADSKSQVAPFTNFENDLECKEKPFYDIPSLGTISSNCRQSLIEEDDLYVAYETSFYDKKNKEIVTYAYDNERCEGNPVEIERYPIKECIEVQDFEGFSFIIQKPFPVMKGNTESTESVESTESIDNKAFSDTSEDGISSTDTVKFTIIGLVVLVASSVAAFCICKQSKTKDTTTNHDEVEFVEL